MQELKEELKTLPKERIFEELKKALESEKPSIFFEVLKQANVLDVHFKEIYDLIGSLQPKQYHPEGDSYIHSMIVLDGASQVSKNTSIRFAALVHDLGKGVTPKQMYPHHYGHDEKGVQLVENLGNRIGLPKEWISYGKVASKEHMKGGIFQRMTPAKKVQFIERVSKTKLGLEGLQIVVNADKCSTRNIKQEEVNFEKIGKECLEQVNGKYIKKKYNIDVGIQFAQKLHQERIDWMKHILE